MGRPAVITKERVAEVTLRLIDEEGLDAVSIERIGSELGVRGPSLYHHFADKAAILTEVARLVLGDLDMDRPGDDWQQWLVDTSLILYRRVLEHPQAAVILMQFMPDASAVPGFGRAAHLLTKAGVDPSVQVLLMEGCEKLIWGWALQRAMAASHEDRRIRSASVELRWPELSTAVRESRWSDEAMVEASLRAFMQGVIDGRAGNPGEPRKTRSSRTKAVKRPARPAATQRARS
ncbi:TetR/AcrR family transcriptional regulator [Desertimonas flava]|jgi:AcrR family transcriptional regulator|uniref:TetR/AcrR family transcriptional regulator n=1 Tax=Desertimonas flava TaxID=2064846 RepID=UPI000E354223|nr:TetR/AcrR family transcriptional regulator [Desertimonas flava]